MVLCGAMMPAAFSRTDAGFNAGNRILDTSQSIKISYYMCMCMCMNVCADTWIDTCMRVPTCACKCIQACMQQCAKTLAQAFMAHRADIEPRRLYTGIADGMSVARRGGQFGCRHAHTRATDIPSAMRI